MFHLQIFSPILWLSLHFCMVSFAVQKLLGLIWSPLLIFVFIFINLGGRSKKILLRFISKNTICKINSQWEFAVWLRKLKQGPCINLEGWMGREMGGRFKREDGVSKVRGYMYTYGWFMLRFVRKQENSVKQLSFNKKINLKIRVFCLCFSLRVL